MQVVGTGQIGNKDQFQTIHELILYSVQNANDLCIMGVNVFVVTNYDVLVCNKKTKELEQFAK